MTFWSWLHHTADKVANAIDNSPVGKGIDDATTTVLGGVGINVDPENHQYCSRNSGRSAPTSLAALVTNCESCGGKASECAYLGSTVNGNVCYGRCSDFDDMNVPMCTKPATDWLNPGDETCGKRQIFEAAQEICRAPTCPAHYDAVIKCTKTDTCAALAPKDYICVKKAVSQVADINQLSAPGFDLDRRKYDCCYGQKRGPECPQNFCSDATTTGKPGCSSFMKTYCEGQAVHYPKKNGTTMSRAATQTALNNTDRTTNLNQYTFMYHDYPGCACLDSDAAAFAKKRSQVEMVTGSQHATVNVNIPESRECWFAPCATAVSHMTDWLQPDCGNIQFCIINQDNSIHAGGDVQIAQSNLAPAATCNQHADGSHTKVTNPANVNPSTPNTTSSQDSEVSMLMRDAMRMPLWEKISIGVAVFIILILFMVALGDLVGGGGVSATEKLLIAAELSSEASKR